MAPYLGGAGAPAPNGLPNNGPTILCIDWAFFSLSSAVVILRLITRIFIVPSFGWDDFCIALAQAINVVGKCLTIEEVANGLGLHQWNIPPANYSRYLKYNYLDWCQVFVTLALSKISICLFLLRLSSFERLRNFLKGMILFIALTHIPLFLLIVFQCNPVNKNWHPERPGTCFSQKALEAITNTQGVISIIIDFVCVGFPIVLLRNTKLKRKTKLGLCMLMGLGLLTAIACIVRVCYSWQIKAEDVTWVGIPNALARIAEVNLGNIAACVPVLKPLFRYCRALITGNDPYDMLHNGSTLNSFSKPSVSHQGWYANAVPTFASRTRIKRDSRNSTIRYASPMGGEHLHGSLRAYSEIENTSLNADNGPEPMLGNVNFARGRCDIYGLNDDEKDIKGHTKIRVVHVEGD